MLPTGPNDAKDTISPIMNMCQAQRRQIIIEPSLIIDNTNVAYSSVPRGMMKVTMSFKCSMQQKQMDCTTWWCWWRRATGATPTLVGHYNLHQEQQDRYDLIHIWFQYHFCYNISKTACVYLNMFSGNVFGAKGMECEEIQWQQILKRWEEAGMKVNDVGLTTNIDETMTRNFLLAAKHCNIPAFQSCQDCH